LVEASLCAVPANPSALLTAKALGISPQTISMVFSQSDTSSIAQRIRKAKLPQTRADTPHKREVMAHAIRIFEKEEQELRESLAPRMSAADRAAERRLAHAKEVRARALATIRRIDEQIAREYAASPAGQAKRYHEETIAAFTAHAQHHLDPVKPTYESYTPTWRGQKLPGLTWRGKKI